MQAANVDAFADGWGTADCNGPISVNLDDLERALERGELLLQGRLSEINEIMNVVIMKNARFVFGNIIAVNLGFTARSEIFPVC